ncbi:MAG: hypothetical protein Q9195_005511 [Heterodermia aff. obscurata]
MTEESVLVIGGCGFVGFHIVEALLKESLWSVHVMSRNPSRNRIQGAHYHTGSVCSPEQLRNSLAEIRPSIIIHAASPTSTSDVGGERQYQDTNVQGTRNLIEASILRSHVKGLIYTSSAQVVDATVHDMAIEDAPIHTLTSRADYYSKSKAIADRMVLDANGKRGVRTLCLRPAAVYGERDSQMIPGFLQVLRDGRHRYQIGDNTNMFDFVSVTNVALSHVLAVKALLSDSVPEYMKADGEAFFITDGIPVPFWTFARKIWFAAGDTATVDQVIIVPAWFMLGLADIVEWAYWIFTFGAKRPKVLRRQSILFACLQSTYSIAKAKERLHYTPLDDRDAQIKKGVDWELQNQTEAPRQL